MRIWFDLSNSPHINMFGALIRDDTARWGKLIKEANIKAE